MPIEQDIALLADFGASITQREVMVVVGKPIGTEACVKAHALEAAKKKEGDKGPCGPFDVYT